MTPEKIISVIKMYETRLSDECIVKVRMDPSKKFQGASTWELLAHAHYLCDGVKQFAVDPDRQRKAGSHLTAVQMCLSFAGWYTLEELMEHNRSESSVAGVRQQFLPGITDFREPNWAT